MRLVAVLYCSLADAPYVGAAEVVAVPSIERVPLTVTVPKVFKPDPASVRLLYVAVTTVCAPDASYWIVPPHVLLAVKGVPDTLCVLIVPRLFIVVTPRSEVVISRVPPAVVFKVVAVMAPPAVSVPLVLLSVKMP